MVSDHPPTFAAPATLNLKRAVDVIVSAAALVFLSPLLLGIAILVVLDSGWPPLFIQERIGLAGKKFWIWKVRTMVVNAEKIGAGLWIEAQDPRFTRIGPFLRKTNLDELPQLANVLRGHMSLVGPRPLHPSTMSRLSPQQHLRHRMRPGLTGWAVLHGRNGIPYSTRFALDNWYIAHWSLGLDLKILLATIPVLLYDKGMKMEQAEAETDDLSPTAGR
jgi:lipopolysaccharide/colanic/teichoic acid biosynthesis glycosyltransferase